MGTSGTHENWSSAPTHLRAARPELHPPHVDQRSADPQDVVKVLNSFFKRYQKLFDVIGDPVNQWGKHIAVIGELRAAGAIKEHFDKVVIAMHTQYALTDHAYQALINYTCNVYIDGAMHIVVVFFGWDGWRY